MRRPYAAPRVLLLGIGPALPFALRAEPTAVSSPAPVARSPAAHAASAPPLRAPPLRRVPPIRSAGSCSA
jgi:hypothetical protein